MNILKNLFFVLTALSFIEHEVWGMDDENPPPKNICLMNDSSEYGSSEWLPAYTVYAKYKGRQCYRLEEDQSYTSSYIRFVKDIPSLTLGYGLLSKDKQPQIPALTLEEGVYGKLADVGAAVKIINGYLQKFDESEKTFTPEKTNFFMPHLSYVIQWKEDSLPEFLPGGELHDQKGRLIVFMSGADKEGNSTTIEQFYNHLYKKAESEEIVIYPGNKVAEQYVPYVLKEAVKGLEIFKPAYLSELSKKMTDRFSYVKSEGKEDNTQAFRNTINITSKFISLLLCDKIGDVFKARQDTVSRLLETFPSEKRIEIPKDGEVYNEKKFTEALQKNKSTFLLAALARIRKLLPSLEEDNQAFVKNIIDYLGYALNPQQLEDIRKAGEFWELIKSLGNCITCANPDAQYNCSMITGAERLRKYALSGYGSHTEQLFIKLVRTEPQLLTQGLEQFIKDNPTKFSGAIKPRLLGFIIDGFSWLDTCEGCGHYLHTNTEWTESLKEVKIPPPFVLPFNQIDSIFRMVSQERYGGPSDISQAEGGKDYRKSGWDYRILSEARYTLATRFPEKVNLLRRDCIFSKIPSAVTGAALAKPIEFWREYSALFKTILDPEKRFFACHSIDILSLRFPDEKSLRIKKIFLAKYNKNFEEVYRLAKPLVNEEITFNADDEKFLEGLFSHTEIDQCPKYINTYFAEACRKKAMHSFKGKKSQAGWDCMAELVRFGFIKEPGEPLAETSSMQIATHMINYWKNTWSAGRGYVSFGTPEGDDKEVAEKSVKLLWKLACKHGKYSSTLEDEQAVKLLQVLENSELKKPKFTSQ